jgi:hypothetical protein
MMDEKETGKKNQNTDNRKKIRRDCVYKEAYYKRQKKQLMPPI